MILKKLYKILLFFFEILLFLYKLPMIFSGYIFSIVIFPYYFLLHNVRIKRYFSSNLIPTNYFALCSSRNFIICLYIQHKSHSTDYSSKEWLSLFLSDTYGKYTRIFIFTQKTSYHLAGFHCIFKTTYMLTFPWDSFFLRLLVKPSPD